MQFAIDKNTIFFLVAIIIIIIVIYFWKSSEYFTTDEMNRYQEAVNINCDNNTKLHKYLQDTNAKQCLAKGKTDRDTINNKSNCYDDIGKEIVTGLDEESYCKLAKTISAKVGSNKILPIKSDDLTMDQIHPVESREQEKYAQVDFSNNNIQNNFTAKNDYSDINPISTDADFLKELAKVKTS